MEQPRRSDAQNGSDGHQRGEASLEIIGQELVPLSASPGEFLAEAGAIQNPPVSSTEIVLATPQSSITGPVVSTVANPVLTLGIATPKSVQSAPNLQLVLVQLASRCDNKMVVTLETQLVIKVRIFCLCLMINSLDVLPRSISRLQWSTPLLTLSVDLLS